MGIKRHKPEEIVTKLRQVEVLCGQGMPRIDALSTTVALFYISDSYFSGIEKDVSCLLWVGRAAFQIGRMRLPA